MNDNEATLSFFKEEIRKFVEARNWNKYHTPKNLIQAMSIEVAELSELFLFKEDKLKIILKDDVLLSKIEEEVADVFIYLISFVNTLNMDLTKLFLNKMKKNKSKYPTKEFNNGVYYKK